MGRSTYQDDEQRVAEVERRLGIPSIDRATALLALTHKSFANEHRSQAARDNERLEFLGDAVIDLAVSDRLMRRFPTAQEGVLSKLRAAVVNEDGLAAIAQSIGLGELLLLGRGEELTGGRAKASLLANAFEAVIGAVYLSLGLEAVLALTDRFFGQALDAAQDTIGRDYKTHLQEKVQELFKCTPRYRVVDEQGPEHSKVFAVEIEMSGKVLGRGQGRCKKDAEQAAAREALRKLHEMAAPPPLGS